MQKKKITMVIAGLGGRGHDIYGNYAMEHPDEVEIVAIADPRKERLEVAQKEWNIPAHLCFSTAEELFAMPQMAQAAVIATQDRQHVAHAEAALKAGYHLLLEKPVAIDTKGCLEVLRMAREYKRHVVVCHVLRYTPFYNTIKQFIEAGRIGEVVTIQAMEQVGYWHHAHSYVRGNWRRADQSSPMILAKCCHDMDILLWLAGKRARWVSSYGSNYLFREAHAPEGSAERCFDCAVRETCPYDAVRYYLEGERTSVKAGRVHWPINVLSPNPTSETIEHALRTGPYGRCVYHCDNDVVDHQVVNMQLEDGVTVNFTMSAFTERCYRTIKVMGTHGCIEGNMDDSHLVWNDFFGHREEIDLKVTDGSMAGHGGGDAVMMKQFAELLASGRDDEMLSSIEHSIESHMVALLAEESRLQNGCSLPVNL
ncbi:MAG TPA: Gfo/Idh/MocA family oxidoreductase [Candidatus Ruthenibacterium merdavium]|uniref:Gfo/Idh/MocA family oxidoreductase n=1 Tax=Candidatus Ruthenibacterium merdavium TaxID=2838752 RepID=A0A9D2TLG4_9FIRM|nr:Gfo/Idh/MocA family oxidoreductase [Candidatus Ruthenibacterium merdavium]